MRDRGDSAGRRNAPYPGRQLGLLPVYVALGRLVKEFVERFLDAGYVSFFQHRLGEMRTAGEAASLALDILDLDVNPQRLQPLC